jgi:hypothetical protein
MRNPPTGRVRDNTSDGGRRGLTGGDDDGSTVPFLVVKVRETAVTKDVKKIKRKALERTGDHSGRVVGGDARVDRATPMKFQR